MQLLEGSRAVQSLLQNLGQDCIVALNGSGQGGIPLKAGLKFHGNDVVTLEIGAGRSAGLLVEVSFRK
jgi:hypothetical protein